MKQKTDAAGIGEADHEFDLVSLGCAWLRLPRRDEHLDQRRGLGYVVNVFENRRTNRFYHTCMYMNIYNIYRFRYTHTHIYIYIHIIANKTVIVLRFDMFNLLTVEYNSCQHFFVWAHHRASHE